MRIRLEVKSCIRIRMNVNPQGAAPSYRYIFTLPRRVVDVGSSTFLTPRSGIRIRGWKNPDPDLIFENLKSVFWIKNSLMWIRTVSGIRS